MDNKQKSLEEIVFAIAQSDKHHKPILIAIEGFGGSGKSTFARSLRDSIKDAYIVNIDDFLIKEKLTDPSQDKVAFDRNRLEKQVLLPAKSGEVIAYQKLIWDTNTLSENITVPEVIYLIVEGISSYHPDIAHYYDYKIWIDAPMEIAMQRGRARDGDNENTENWDLWAENDLKYQQRYHPELQADFIFDSSSSDADS